MMCPGYNQERRCFMLDIMKKTDDTVFNCILNDPSFAVAILLGDHDNVFNQCFLDFVTKIWSKRDSF